MSTRDILSPTIGATMVADIVRSGRDVWQWEIAAGQTSYSPIVVDDIKNARLPAPHLRNMLAEGYRSALIAPLVADEVLIGTLTLGHRSPRVFTPENAQTAFMMAMMLTSYAKIFRRIETIQKAAETDELTGLHNRRAFRVRLEALYEAHKSSGEVFSLILFDLDHFKYVNDTHGHVGGDVILTAVADTVRSVVRHSDHFARIGGEEFAVLAAGLPQIEAVAQAERFRTMIDGIRCLHNSRKICCTASFGVAAVSSEDHDVDRLLRRTDAALYAAKETGRNRVAVATEEEFRRTLPAQPLPDQARLSAQRS